MTATTDEAAILRKGIEDVLTSLRTIDESLSVQVTRYAGLQDIQDLHAWWVNTRAQRERLKEILAQADAVKEEIAP